MSREIKRVFFEKVVIPKIMYGSETWSLNVQQRRKLEKLGCQRERERRSVMTECIRTNWWNAMC